MFQQFIKIMANKQKLELTWVGKEKRAKLEPRILIEDPDKSYHASKRVSKDDIFDNILIKGDNLLALKALEQDYAGKVKCIYIDPPYNTGNAFEHYDDGLEHSIWLSLMRERLEILRRLLSEDGVLFVQIDDAEQAYLKILLDEIFGRRNFCGQFVWEKKKKPSFLNANMGIITEYILSYSPNREKSPAFIGGLTTEGKKYPLNNAGNSLQVLKFPVGSVTFTNIDDGVVLPQDMSEGNIKTKLLDKLIIKDKKNENEFRLEGEWRYSQRKLDEIIEAKEQLIISKIPFRPNHIKTGGEAKKIKNLLTVAHFNMATYEDSNKETIDLFGTDKAFDYPKPEMLIHTLLSAVTNPGDLVLDSFLGSGTTAAVAHKMGRRWIGIELGEHCDTHCVPRLKKVIDGEDQGGITKSVNWQGGGGFRYYNLAPSLIKFDEWGNPIINKQFDENMLVRALCKVEGFEFNPSPDEYWKQGRSTETDFIYVTTQHLTSQMLQKLSEDVGENCTLLICCGSFDSKKDSYENLTIKKIPKAILKKCEWNHDDYSLEIKNLPMADHTPTPQENFAKKSFKKQKDDSQQMNLFGSEE